MNNSKHRDTHVYNCPGYYFYNYNQCNWNANAYEIAKTLGVPLQNDMCKFMSNNSLVSIANFNLRINCSSTPFIASSIINTGMWQMLNKFIYAGLRFAQSYPDALLGEWIYWTLLKNCINKSFCKNIELKYHFHVQNLHHLIIKEH